MVVGKIFLFDVILNINKDIKKKYLYRIYLSDRSVKYFTGKNNSGTLAHMITHLTRTKIVSATAQFRSKKHATDFNEKLCTIKIGH